MGDMKLIEKLKEKILLWSLKGMIEMFTTDLEKGTVEIHLRNGKILYTEFDKNKTEIEQFLIDNKLKKK